MVMLPHTILLLNAPGEESLNTASSSEHHSAADPNPPSKTTTTVVAHTWLSGGCKRKLAHLRQRTI